MASALGECGLADSSASSEFSDPGLDLGLIEMLRVEGPAVPAHQFVMLLVIGIGHGVEEELEAGDSADILWRATPGAIDVSGIVRAGVRGEDGLVAAEVVRIGEFGDAAIDECAELGRPSGEGPVAQAIPFRMEDGVALPIGAELEESRRACSSVATVRQTISGCGRCGGSASWRCQRALSLTGNAPALSVG